MRPKDKTLFQQYCEKYHLQPHPEQEYGYFYENFRDAPMNVDSTIYKEEVASRTTSVYFALTDDGKIEFNQVKDSTKYYQYCDGSAQHVYILDEKKNSRTDYILGNPSLHGWSINNIVVTNQIVILPHQWVAAELIDKESFSLMTCTVSPGFDFKRFILADKEMLTNKFPEYQELIQQFTPAVVKGFAM